MEERRYIPEVPLKLRYVNLLEARAAQVHPLRGGNVVTSVVGPNRTKRPDVTMSIPWGRPEIAGELSNRRN
jgi:hypothetical protein